MAQFFFRIGRKGQSSVVLSSGEAELCAVSMAGEHALGIRAILAEFGFEVKLELHSDATAAIGMCRRLGLGRVRHLAVADLWIQQKVRDGDLSLFKVPGKQNIADIGQSTEVLATLSPCLSMPEFIWLQAGQRPHRHERLSS